MSSTPTWPWQRSTNTPRDIGLRYQNLHYYAFVLYVVLSRIWDEGMNPHCLRFQPTCGVAFLRSRSMSSTENIPCTLCCATDHSTVLRNAIQPDTENKRGLLFVSIQGDTWPHLSSTAICLMAFIALTISSPIYSSQKKHAIHLSHCFCLSSPDPPPLSV